MRALRGARSSIERGLESNVHGTAGRASGQGDVHDTGTAGTGRVEAFSDGVMAIAITLLTLNLSVPTDAETAASHGLLQALVDHWPNYLAYLAAFLTIGIIWLNHRALVDKIARFDHTLLWLNLLLLLTVAVLPFPTALLAAYLREGGTDASTAASLYGLVATLMAGGWWVIWRHLRAHPNLLRPPFDRAYAGREERRAGYGALVYLGSMVVAVLVPVIALLGYVAIAVFYGIAREGAGRELLTSEDNHGTAGSSQSDDDASRSQAATSVH